MRQLSRNECQLIEQSVFFDEQWYYARYPDVALCGMSAVDHFTSIGIFLQRDPGPAFSVAAYLDDYPDIKQSNKLAVLHFLTQGKHEGRRVRSDSGKTLLANELSWQPLHATHANQLEHKGEDNWLTVGTDPYFIYVLPPQQDKHWILIEVVQNTNTILSGRWYVDYGQGFSEETAYSQHLLHSLPNRKILPFTPDVRHLRFDPTDKADFALSVGLRYCIIDDATATEWLTFENTSLLKCDVKKLYQLSDEWLSQATTEQPYSIDTFARHLFDFSNAMKMSDDQLYQNWIVTVEEGRKMPLLDVQDTLLTMKRTPLISIVVPVYNAPIAHLKQAIESVLQQQYPHWELCLADDASTDTDVVELLRSYAAKDQRIKLVVRPENGHISAASNSALALAKGDYIALLDQDDLLAEDALLWVALTLNEQPHLKVIYSDEDKVDEFNRRFSPHFKSDWNRDLFLSQNYLSHLGVYQHDLIRYIGGFRLGVEGSQDYDLMLRCLLHINDNDIFHIPRVLYHWRALEGSTALSATEKTYTDTAGLRALTDFFTSAGLEGVTVETGLADNTYKVNWPLPASLPKVSLLIPTRDRRELTEVAVRSILDKTHYANYEIVILDNGSVEADTLQFFADIVQEDSRVTVLKYDYPFNYSAINNFGVRHTTGDIIGLVNNDVEVINPQWLGEMVSHASRKDIGCVGAKLYYSNGTLQHGGVIMSLGGVAGHSHKHFPGDAAGYFNRLKLVQNLSGVTAACLLVRREVYLQVGGLEEEKLKVAFNDVDFCLKVRAAGYRNLWTPYAELFHHESVSRGHEDTPEKQQRFASEINYMQQKWPAELQYDPYYSINLTRDREDFSISVD
ncbi:glycosyltransferase family 2 protein [Rheinheimera baltica]|uniref:glycosyltransferase family 2 protein n=1 Tax=Rheinheimera baltica TaxID=67576 RepID=UPI00273F0964|nr:glycosyltransferase family 2 protein [Rheinheimera baltica]MDP5149750.1 glycosyltransferase family 2 protein [Rheinheimera baltica]